MAVGGNLNEKQRRFVAAYVEGLDPHKAALAAGYKPRGARRHGERLLGRRPIVEAIARLAGGAPAPAASPPRTPITRAWITEELTDLYKTVKACVAGSGEPGGKAPSGASLQSVIKTLELLIKHLEAEGLRGAAGAGVPEPDLSRLTRDELRQLESILARAEGEPGPEGSGPAQPF